MDTRMARRGREEQTISGRISALHCGVCERDKVRDERETRFVTEPQWLSGGHGCFDVDDGRAERGL